MSRREFGMPQQGATLQVMTIAALSGVLGGVQAVATRYVLPELPPLELAIMRFSLAALCMVPLLLIWGRAKISMKDLLASIGLGVMFFGLFPYLFAAAFQYSTAARGALVLGAMPVLTLFLAAAMGREKLSQGKMIGAFVTLGGVLAVVGEGAFAADAQGEAWKGDALLLIGVVIGALFNIGSKPVLGRVPTLTFCAIIIISGATAMALAGGVVGAFSEPIVLSPGRWAALIFLGTAGGFIPILMWNYALARVTPAQSAVAVGLNPVTAALGGVLLLGETMGLPLLFGLGLVLAGLVWTARG